MRFILKFEHKTDREWFGISEGPLDFSEIHEWVIRPDCGAVSLFSGCTRNHSKNSDGVVTRLEYEAYESQALESFKTISADVFKQCPKVGRVAICHRTGVVNVSEISVIAAVSAPHRSEAFFYTEFLIKKLKEISPIWKKETSKQKSNWI